MKTILSDLHGYLTALAAASPDGTAELNGVGFSSATIGPGLAILRRFPYWTAPDAIKAHEIVVIHSKQLGVNRDALALAWNEFRPSLDAELAALAAEAREIAAAEVDAAATSNSPFGIVFADWKEVETRRGPAKVRSGEPSKAFWDAYKADKERVKDAGFAISKFAGAWQVSQWEARAAAPARELIAPAPLANALGLLSYQSAPASVIVAALRNFGAAVDASDTGTGKTYTALAACRELGFSPVVIAPKAVLPSWKRAAAHLDVNLAGVVNYEAIRTGNTQYGAWEKAELPWKGEKGEKLFEDVFRFAPGVSALVFDEAHRCKGQDTANALLMRAAAEQKIPAIALSATLAHSPLEMRAIGGLLGLTSWRNFWKWTLRNGCSKGPWGGFEFDGSKYVLDRLHAEIFPSHGSRVKVADLGDLFPKTQIAAEAYNLNGAAAEIDRIDEEMHREIAALEERAGKDKSSARAAILVAMLRARQKAELVKVPLFVELATDAVEEGQSVAVFVCFRETLDAIVSRLETAKIGAIETIKGGQDAGEREAGIARFQADTSHCIVAMISAGGVGVSLHDLNGNRSRFAVISPTWSAVELRQALGRVHRAEGKTPSVQRIVFVAESVEEKVRQSVAAKLDRLDTLNDGDMGKPDGGSPDNDTEEASEDYGASLEAETRAGY